MKKTSNDLREPVVTTKITTPVLGQQKFCPHYVSIFQTPAASPELVHEAPKPWATNGQPERQIRVADSFAHTSDVLEAGDSEPMVEAETT